MSPCRPPRRRRGFEEAGAPARAADDGIRATCPLCTREYIKRSARQRICSVCRAEAPHRSVGHILAHGLHPAAPRGKAHDIPADGDAGEGTAAAPAAALRAPSPEPPDEDGDPDELDDVPELDGAEADDVVDEVAAPAPPLRGHDQPLRITYPERKCVTPSCRRLFQPTHPAQKYCPRCRGFRVTEEPKDGASESWWTETTSREDFQKRAADRQDVMQKDPENRKVRLQILGEKGSI